MYGLSLKIGFKLFKIMSIKAMLASKDQYLIEPKKKKKRERKGQ